MTTREEIEAMPTYRLLMGLQGVVKASWDAADKEALAKDDEIVDRLFSDEGYRHPNYDQAAPQTNALAAGFQLLGAYHNAESFSEHCATLFHVKGATNAVKADWCRSLGWHYTYVLRERCLAFISTIRKYLGEDPRLLGWKDQLNDCARTFKKKTDRQLTDRGKHVHNYTVDDPFAEQIGLIELLTHDPESREAWQTILKWRQRTVRKTIRERARADVDSMKEHANGLIVGSEPVWSAIYAMMAEQHKQGEARKSA